MKRIVIIITTLITLLSGSVTCKRSDPNERIRVTSLRRELNDITVVISQQKRMIDTLGIPPCRADIRLLNNGRLIDSIIYTGIDPVGGQYGLLVYSGLVNNHLIISKFGDFDGETIIINDKGQHFETIGGQIYADTINGLLFSIYDSFLSGFSVFDVNKEKEIFRMTDIEERPAEFFRADNRYFFTAINDDSKKETLWEIEFDQERLMYIDPNNDSIRKIPLKQLENYKQINLDCESMDVQKK